jgi:hypothetical protein
MKKTLPLLLVVLFLFTIPDSTAESLHENTAADEYDMVIITPERFVNAAQPLAVHKTQHGITTYIKTTQEIYQNYTGRDAPEQIKLFIKDAIEQHHIHYVLLLGGRKGQSLQYYIPGRYVHLSDGYFDTTYLSDLYYADIYKANTTAFDDWDSNGDGIYAEWGIDTLDLTPDVYVGRLPCRYLYEARNIVHKIIAYENGDNHPWFDQIIVAGGDTNPGYGDPFPFEGEAIGNVVCDIMENFTATKLYVSDNTLTSASNFIRAFSQGCGFLLFEGHGLQNALETYDTNQTLMTVFQNAQIPLVRNKEKYPVCVFGCCVTGKFDVGLLNILNKGPLNLGEYGLSDCIPEELAWRLVRQRTTGAIATIASTSIVWGYVGDVNHNGIPDIVENGLLGWINVEFFRQYAQEEKHILGQAFGDSIQNYVSTFPVHSNKLDCKTIQEQILIGDPSLMIGGYPL